MQRNQPITLLMATAMLSHTEAELSMKPIRDFAIEHGYSGTQNLTTFPTFGEMMQSLGNLESLGLNNYQIPVSMSSRIIPRANFQGTVNKQSLVRALKDIMHTSDPINGSSPSIPPLLVCLTTPATYSQNLPDTDHSAGTGYPSVTPAWRTRLWHVIHKRTWGNEADSSSVARIWKKTSQAMSPLRQMTPGGGAYQNEGDAFEPNPIDAFWGKENYDRLLSIKRVVDPGNVFTVHQGIGWPERDPRWDCYPR